MQIGRNLSVRVLQSCTRVFLTVGARAGVCSLLFVLQHKTPFARVQTN